MNLNKRKELLKYFVADFFSAACVWVLFFLFRKIYIEAPKYGVVDLSLTPKFVAGVILVPIAWTTFYYILGYYKDPFRKSRLNELSTTFAQSLIGVIIMFFALLLDDDVLDYTSYYKAFLVLFGLHFSFTLFFRLWIVTKTVHKVHNRIIGYNTLVVGSSKNAIKLFKELESAKKSSGFKLVGFVNVNGTKSHPLKSKLPHLGHIEEVTPIVKANEIEEVIIAIEPSEHHKLKDIIAILDEEYVNIKIIPDMYTILTGQVKMNSIFGAPLIDISKEIMPPWQQSLKRIFDISISLIVLILFSWLYIIVGLIVKFTSKGPIIYSQERIGKYGKPFKIFKFRSMYHNAEGKEPLLSSSNDNRITPFGSFLRKTRLDEIPQFYNVLIGDMSIVGPRPERAYFIEKIKEVAPQYSHLQKVRPGITSWGQVKFGYAENVDEMVRRLEYDILYIENMSLIVDFKILIYTVLIVLKGAGK